MTKTTHPKLQELITKLREIFQIDRPELDFGIYRILNARADEINDYLENRLPEKIDAALAEGNSASTQQLQKELDDAIKQAQALEADPDTVPKVQALRKKLADMSASGNEHKNAVFSHLLTFFSRYYQDGDFISQRRYKGDTYAIPYAGEEVMLHWANKDQYYTKSGENFSNYSFKLEDGRTVHFRLVAADTAKDNRKDNDKERRFALIQPRTVIRQDEQGEDYEEQLVPVEEVAGADGHKELLIRFEYAAQPKGTKQEALVSKAVETVLSETAVKARWLALAKRAPTEKNPQRTLLEKHLSDYTTKNTADYFIHKDLGGFLRRELDFYIKNEVMHLDDVQNAGAFADIEKNLRMIQCLRSIALELISFLAQLENFQKKLWLKKKFVVSSHYCITLDRVSEDLYQEILKNDLQWEKWKKYGFIDEKVPRTLNTIKDNKQLPIETIIFDNEFKWKLLSSFDNLDSSLDGLLIKGDNFQCINLIKYKYQNNIKCIYIDPPYNTGNDEFIYKDGFQSSTWTSLINTRLSAAKPLLKHSGILAVSLDQREVDNLSKIVHQSISLPLIQRVIWKKTDSPNEKDNAISNYHEYISIYGNDGSKVNLNQLYKPEILDAYPEKEDDGRKFRLRQARKNGTSARRTDRPSLFYPITAPDGTTVLPIAPEGWEGRWVMSESTYKDLVEKSLIVWKERDYGWVPYYKEYAPQEPMAPYSSIWDDIDQNRQAKTEYTALLGDLHFSNPKPSSLIARIAKISCKKDDFLLDFFAGSGTSASSIIRLQREDGIRRRFILIEQGAHFESILIPRVLKSAYSTQWSDGRIISIKDPQSYLIKINYVESYEDTLNNLLLYSNSIQTEIFEKLPQKAKDDYLLNYMLDVESRGSLLSVEDFKKPFDYTLNIAVDSAGAYEPRKIDLVETFNYLIGLHVKHIEANMHEGYVRVEGTLPSGESTLVIWRDCEKINYDTLKQYGNRFDLEGENNPFDVIYINGDHNMPSIYSPTEGEEGKAWTRKIRQIEPEFLERMFSVEDV